MHEVIETVIETADGSMELFVASPTGQAERARGAIVVVQEAFGVTAHIESVCEWLADEGWLAPAPAFFHRQEPQRFAYDDLAGAVPVMMTLTKEGIDADLDAVVGYLTTAGFTPDRIGIVGFCMGGSVTLYAAATRSLGAAITFYGGGLATGRFGFPPGVELAGALQTPWLGLYGDLDQGIPVDDVERVRENAAATSVDSEVVRYANAQHGFNCNDRPAVFDPEASADARGRLLAWLDRHMTR